MKTSSTRKQQELERAELLRRLGSEIVRFQDGTNEVDDAASHVLALERRDLQCLSLLLFVGAAPLELLSERLRAGPSATRSMIERLELAGYVRRTTKRSGLVEMTDHARRWIETIWGPLGREGERLLGGESTRDLRVLLRFLEKISPVQEVHAARIRALLDVPARDAKNRLKGGLSPAALRRVQLFVGAHLARPLSLAELAERAGLSVFHFTRAFKTTMGTTPRAYLEAERIDRARHLLLESHLPVAQIALDCGLGTQSRFTTVFRRATGFTPAAFRRGHA